MITSTARLSLREVTESDAPFVCELMNEPGYLRFIGDRKVRTTEQAATFIAERLAPSYRVNGFGLWLCERQEDGEALGLCGLVRRAYLQDVDLGYAFLARHGGQGYASEAAAAVLALARAAHGLKRIVAICTQDNARSLALLHSLGFRENGTVTAPEDGTVLALMAHDAV